MIMKVNAETHTERQTPKINEWTQTENKKERKQEKKFNKNNNNFRSEK